MCRQSRKVFKSLKAHELVADANWRQLVGFSHFEPSIRVQRGGAPIDSNLDTVVLSAILRKHAWKSTGWLRLEVRRRARAAHARAPSAGHDRRRAQGVPCGRAIAPA